MASPGLLLLISSGGLAADHYLLSSVNLVRPFIQLGHGQMSPSQDAVLTSASLTGCIAGMLLFGALADRFGRRLLYVGTGLLVSAGSLASCLASPCFGLGLYTVLAVCRFLLGLGIGGEYPLAAAFTVEQAGTGKASRPLAVVFGGVALGQLLGPVVVLGLDWAVSPEGVWRATYGLGALFGLAVTGLRLAFLPEPAGWSALQTTKDEHTGRRCCGGSGQLGLTAMCPALVGVSGAWLLYDVVAYGIGLYTSEIFPGAGPTDSAQIMLLIGLLTAPGFGLGVLLAPHCRLQRLQLYGLFGLGLSLIVVALAPASCPVWAKVVVFGAGRAVDVAGPGLTTFSIPGEIFPTRIRASAHGVAAAAGKVGALLGAGMFPLLRVALGLTPVLILLGLVCGLAMAWTWALVPLYDRGALQEIAAAEQTPGLSAVDLAQIANRVLVAGEEHYVSAQEAFPIGRRLQSPRLQVFAYGLHLDTPSKVVRCDRVPSHDNIHM